MGKSPLNFPVNYQGWFLTCSPEIGLEDPRTCGDSSGTEPERECHPSSEQHAASHIIIGGKAASRGPTGEGPRDTTLATSSP